MLPIPGHFDGNFGHTVLAEEVIEGFQQSRFESGYHLRRFGLKLRRSMKIEGSAPQAVGSIQVHARASHTKAQISKCDCAASQGEVTSQLRQRIILMLIIRTPLRPVTEVLDFFSHAAISKRNFRDSELAFQL